MTAPGQPSSQTSSRVRALCGHAAGVGLVGSAVAWLNHTAGYAVAPGGLLTCPLYATTGLWCPFCGGLRCVAALTQGDIAAAASFNVVLLLLMPVVVVGWALAGWSAWRGRARRFTGVGNRGWIVLGVVLLVFAVWRNLPALPLAGFLAP